MKIIKKRPKNNLFQKLERKLLKKDLKIKKKIVSIKTKNQKN